MKGSAMKKPGMTSVPVSPLFKRRFAASSLTIAITLSVTLLYASTGGGEGEGGMNWSGFAWRSFNFVILAGFLYWLLAGKAKDFFNGRQQEIKASLTEAEVAKDEAIRKFAEYDAKLTKATEEIQELVEMIRLQGLAEKERIVADARRNAAKIKDDARKRMDQELKKARNELRTEAVRLSVQMAEEILKKQITQADHVGLVENYIDKVVTKH
jgi:F-type H+-transporting ATPase subunit b